MSQKSRILNLLKERGETGVSVREAVYNLRITRLAAIIFELKSDGYQIETQVRFGETARYTLRHGRNQRGAPESILSPQFRRPRAPASFDPYRDEPVPPSVAMPLALPCGCVRAANGQAWEEQCARHEIERQRTG